MYIPQGHPVVFAALAPQATTTPIQNLPANVPGAPMPDRFELQNAINPFSKNLSWGQIAVEAGLAALLVGLLILFKKK